MGNLERHRSQRTKPGKNTGEKALTDDLFAGRIPSHCLALAVAFYGHAAGNRNAETEVKWAVRSPSVADAVDEILHVRSGRTLRLADEFSSVGTVHFLRFVNDLLALGNGPVRAE